jgi:hypothetical protein
MVPQKQAEGKDAVLRLGSNPDHGSINLMARAKRKNTIKIADADLFKRHDVFAKSYARMKKHDTPAASREWSQFDQAGTGGVSQMGAGH